MTTEQETLNAGPFQAWPCACPAAGPGSWPPDASPAPVSAQGSLHPVSDLQAGAGPETELNMVCNWLRFAHKSPLLLRAQK